MTISVLREATGEDFERIEKSAKRFCEFHGIEVMEEIEETYEDAVLRFITYADEYHDKAYYNKLWLACFRRAVKNNWPDCIAYGHVGKRID